MPTAVARQRTPSGVTEPPMALPRRARTRTRTGRTFSEAGCHDRETPGSARTGRRGAGVDARAARRRSNFADRPRSKNIE